jgi:hypothetical protein
MENNTIKKPMENKLTPVEWLVQELINSGLLYPISEMSKTIEQAKAMEKQQIIDAANLPIKDRWYVATKYSNCGEQYYSKTYGK